MELVPSMICVFLLLFCLSTPAAGLSCYECAIFDVLDECHGFDSSTTTRTCSGSCVKFTYTLKTDIGKTKGEEHLCSHDLLHPGATTDPCTGNENSCFHWDSMTHDGNKIENIKVCCCSGNLCNSSARVGGSVILSGLAALLILVRNGI